MTSNFLRSTLLAALALGATATQGIAQSDRFDALANLPFPENRPSAEASQTLSEELLFQRATQTYLWALPLINTLGMKFGSEKVFGSGYNVLPIWKKRLDAKTLVTTPNSDVIYAMSYVDLGKDGPLVFEVPPNLQGISSISGSVPSRWMAASSLAMFDPRSGRWKGRQVSSASTWPRRVEIPAGYFVYRSATNNVFIFLRSFYQDPKNLNPAVALIEQSRIYPLKGEETAKPMVFPDASGVPANVLPVNDGRAFDQLKKLVDSEGSELASADGLGMLASIDIVKDQPFAPDARTRLILDRAAKTA